MIGSRHRVRRTDRRLPYAELQSVREAATSADPPSLRLDTLGRDFAPDEPRWRAAVARCVVDAFALARSIDLYDVQVLAGLAMLQGQVAEMATGEGKTFAAAIPAAGFASAGRGMHVVTANDYLAERDAELLAPVYAALGLQALPLPPHDPADVQSPAKAAAYSADITYGTGHEFGFDRLRDELAATPAHSFARRLTTPPAPRQQRSQFAAVVDETDHVLLDDALSPLILAEQTSPLAPDADAFRLAREVALALAPADFTLHPHVALTPSGREAALDRLEESVAASLQRPWLEYVRQAVQAEHRLLVDRDYLVGPPKPPERGGDGQPEVQLVDASTGRIFEDRTLSDGLHQALETKEQLPIRGGTRVRARITKQRLFGDYTHLCGMTGTAAGCHREFATIYGLALAAIPLHRPSLRVVSPPRLFRTSEQKWVATAGEALQAATSGRCVLVGTASIASSASAAAALQAAGADPVVLDGLNDASEADIVAAAGQPGRITVATNLAGRGTDIALAHDARAAGGLHVIVAEMPVSERVQRQLIGRAARQGDPGSAVLFLAADEPLLADHAPWLAEAIANVPATGRTNGTWSTALARLQNRLDRDAERSRIELWRRDLQRDDWLSQLVEAGSRSLA